MPSQSGLTTAKPTDERNYMVLYSLAVLPLISICDEDTFDDLFSDLIMNIDKYDGSTFSDHLTLLYDRFVCLGITCDMVGTHSSASDSWPKCSAPPTAIAGYVPTSEAPLEVSTLHPMTDTFCVSLCDSILSFCFVCQSFCERC